MPKKKRCFTLNLQIFADGGEGAGGDAGVSATGENAQNAQAERHEADAQNAGTQTESRAAPDGNNVPDTKTLDDEWKELKQGKFKDQYGKDVQSAVNKRFKTVKATEDRLNSLSPIMADLAKKYGVADPNDYDAILKAYADDDARYQEEAEQLGVPVATVKKMKQTEAELAQMREAEESRQKQEAAQTLYNDWSRQAVEVQKLYPSFDLKTETENADFMKYLAMPNMTVKEAYEHAHLQDILGATVNAVASKTQADVARAVASNKARPQEGSRANQGVQTTTDPSKLTHEQLEQIRLRVARGETIDPRSIKF